MLHAKIVELYYRKLSPFFNQRVVVNCENFLLHIVCFLNSMLRMSDIWH
jgi:hypothetical protein